MRRAPVVVAVAGAGIAAAVYSLGVANRDPTFSFAGRSAPGRVALAGAGLALIAAGLGFWVGQRRSSFGPLLVAGGFAWFVIEWNSPGVTSSIAFTAGLVLSAACPALVGHAVLAFPGGRLSTRLQRIVVATAYAGSVVVVGLLAALFFDPAVEGCGECARNLLSVTARDHVVDELDRIAVWLGVVWAITLALLVVLKGVRSSAAARRSRWLVLISGAVYLSLVAAMYAAWLDHRFLWNGQLERRLWLGQAAALVGIALGVAWSWAQSRRSRSAVARLVVELAHSPPPGGLRDALSVIVRDPSLELAYPLAGSDRLVDAEGRPLVLSASRQQTALVGDGRVLAVIGHAPGLLGDEQLVAEVTAAARLALENERLQAEVRARLDELRRSRARIVEAGDGERRRLERDLHDGAQQRLVGLSLSLRLLRSRLADKADLRDAKLAAADANLQGAIEGLREIAHGIFPAVLADGGLGAAVGALAEDARVPLRIEGLSMERFAPVVESAAYMLVAEAAAAATGGLVVRASRSRTTLALEVEAPEVGERLDEVELEDRVGAADGRLTLARSNGGVRISAEFPCGL